MTVLLPGVMSRIEWIKSYDNNFGQNTEERDKAETFFVPHSSMARWVKVADKVVMIDGCFLKCLGRVLNKFVEEGKIVHVDALQLYKKYTDLFDMEDVPEAERIKTARQVADQILSSLREKMENQEVNP